MICAKLSPGKAMNDSAIYETHLEHLELIARGKVRDIYSIDDEHLLMVASDRFSAFDVVFADPIPHSRATLRPNCDAAYCRWLSDEPVALCAAFPRSVAAAVRGFCGASATGWRRCYVVEP